MDLFFDITKDAANSLIVDATNNVTSFNFPQLITDSKLTLNLYPVDGSNGYASWAGDGAYAIKVAFAVVNEPPTGGMWKLKGDGMDLTGTTAEINFDADATDVLNAITDVTTGLTSVAEARILISSDVSITKIGNSAFVFEFRGALKEMNLGALIAIPDGLTPKSTYQTNEIRKGDSKGNELQQILIYQDSVAYQETWTPITDGWTGTIDLDTPEMAQKLAGAENLSLYFAIQVTDDVGNKQTFVRIQTTVLASIITDGITATQIKAGAAYYTKAEVDTLLAALLLGEATGQNFRVLDGTIQIFNSDTGKYETIWITGSDGSPKSFNISENGET